MARTRIEDLPMDTKISRADSRAIMGGGGTVNTCQTPSGGAIPLPFPNMDPLTESSDTADLSTTADGISTSTGDAAGAAGGTISGGTHVDSRSFPSSFSTSLTDGTISRVGL